MNNPLSSLPKSIREECVWAVVPATGSIRDWSVVGAMPTVSGVPRWIYQNGVNGIKNETGQFILYAHDDRQLVSSYTIFVAFNEQLKTDGVTRTIVRKDSTGNGAYTWQLESGRIALTCASVTASLYQDPTDARSLAVRLVGGSSPEYFKDGAFLGDPSINLTPGTDAANLFAPGANTEFLSPYAAVLITGHVCTDQETALLHDWGMSLKSPERVWPGYGGGTLSRPTIVGPDEGLVAGWDLGQLNNGVVPDLSGNGHDGSVDGPGPQSVATSIGRAMKFLDDQYGLAVGDLGVSSGDITIALEIKRDNLVAARTHVFDSTSPRVVCALRGAADAICMYDGSWRSFDVSFPAGFWVHLVYQVEGSTCRAFMNGKQIGADQPWTATGLGSYALVAAEYGGSSFAMQIRSMRVYNRAWSADEVKRDYERFAHTLTFHSFPDTWRVSLADEGGVQGLRLSNTPWYFGDSVGRFRVIDDDTYGKCIKCVTAGKLVRDGAAGDGGTLAIRRNQTEWTVLEDSAGITELNLVAGDLVGLEKNVVRPLKQDGSSRHFTFTTTGVSQDWAIRVISGGAWWINWGDGTFESYTGIGTDQNVSHAYTEAGTYTIVFGVEDPSDFLKIDANFDSLSGVLPQDLSVYDNLLNVRLEYNPDLHGQIPPLPQSIVQLYLNSCGFEGPLPALDLPNAWYVHLEGNWGINGQLPSLDQLGNVRQFYISFNALTGSLPSLDAMVQAGYITLHGNAFTGTLPSLSALVNLGYFTLDGNQFSGYTPSTIALTCYYFRANNNQLPTSAVDQILTDFTTDAASRPSSGTINLSGQNPPAPPTPSVLAAAQAALPGWTIITD